MPLTDVELKVSRAIESQRQRLRDDLAIHASIPTGMNHAPGLDAYRDLIARRLIALNATARVVPGETRPEWMTLPAEARREGRDAIPPTLLIGHRASKPTPRVLIAGHLDTVHDPHGLFQHVTIADDGKTATGPGVVDMKGGILIAIAALEALHEHSIDLDWTFLLNSDEETGSSHSATALRQAAMQHDIGIALEPALPDGSLVVERGGSGQFKVEVFGRAAHVGREFTRGVSAVAKLADIITKLAAMSDPQRGLMVNVGPLAGGSVTNVVPDYAACWCNVRFANEAGARELEQRFDALQTSADAMPRVLVHRAFNRPAKPRTPEVMRLAEQVREAASDLDQSLAFASTGGVCDGNILQDVGLPTIDTLGVRGGNLHRNDEFIDLASLVERAQLLAVLLMRIARDESNDVRARQPR